LSQIHRVTTTGSFASSINNKKLPQKPAQSYKIRRKTFFPFLYPELPALSVFSPPTIVTVIAVEQLDGVLIVPMVLPIFLLGIRNWLNFSICLFFKKNKVAKT